VRVGMRSEADSFGRRLAHVFGAPRRKEGLREGTTGSPALHPGLYN